MPRYLYHITHIKNLKSIVKEEGLWCEAQRVEKEIECKNIAYIQLKDRRSRRKVPCGKGGTLSDYVPFYFAPRSPMLYTINQGNVTGYEEGQRPVVHLVTTVEQVQKADLPFVFTDGHAVIDYSHFFEDVKDLKSIDWNIMEKKYWHNTADDGERMRRRQAEFLIHQFVPWNIFLGIGVVEKVIAEQVEEIIKNVAHCPKVKVIKGWYYD